MASIRTLKKDINILSYDLLTKCFAYRSNNPKLDEEKFDEIIKKIVLLRNDLILRVNHPETDAESENLGEHYRRIKEDLYTMLGTVEELK